MTRRHLLALAAATLTLAAAACSSAPDTAGLRDSFAQQLGSNTFIADFQRNGDDLTFLGPGPEGGTTKWQVHIDSTTVEAQDDERQPYKGTVKSSWTADGKPVVIAGAESNLPIELLANGISQDCWAFWDALGERWSWE